MLKQTVKQLHASIGINITLPVWLTKSKYDDSKHDSNTAEEQLMWDDLSFIYCILNQMFGMCMGVVPATGRRLNRS